MILNLRASPGPVLSGIITPQAEGVLKIIINEYPQGPQAGHSLNIY